MRQSERTTRPVLRNTGAATIPQMSVAPSRFATHLSLRLEGGSISDPEGMGARGKNPVISRNYSFGIPAVRRTC